jgi:hypothetical protein
MPGHAAASDDRGNAGPPWPKDIDEGRTRFPIARLRYTKAPKRWRLYWRDRHLRFHPYHRLAPTPRAEDLPEEIDRNPTAIFWDSNRANRPQRHDRGVLVRALDG